MRKIFLPTNTISKQTSLTEKTYWSAIASFCKSFVRFVSGIIVARMLGPDSMGRVVYMIWMIEIVGIFTDLGLQNSLTRYLAELHGKGLQEQSNSFIRWIYLRYIFLSLIGLIIIVFWTFKFSVNVNLKEVWLLLFFLFFMQALSKMYSAYIIGQQRFDILARINIVSSLFQICCLSFGIYFFGLKGGLCGYIAGEFLPALYSFSMLKIRSSKTQPDLIMLRRVKKYAFNTWLAAIVSAVVWSRFEIFFIERYWNAREVSMFTVGITLANLATIGPLLLMGAFMPHFAELSGEKNTELIQKTYAAGTRLIAFLLFPLCFGSAALMPVLLPLIFGSEFLPAVPNAIVLVATSSLSFAGIGSSLIYGLERSGFIALGGFIGAVLSIIAGVVIIPVYGAWGAVWSRLVVQSLMIALGMWYIACRIGCPVPFRALGQTLLAAIICAGSAWIVIYFWTVPFAIVIAIPVGAFFYLLSVKLFKVLETSDIQRLENALSMIPMGLASPLQTIIKWVGTV